jgi:hypothetical protein
MVTNKLNIVDPIKFAALNWPDIRFYKEQQDVIYSLVENRETVVVAGNKLGKDYVAAFLAIWFFESREPCRIITTSAKDDHLRVLWGEMGNFIQTSKYPLKYSDGGNLIVNQREIKKMVNGEVSDLSYCRGMVASADKIAAMQGHHIAATGDGIPRTLFLSDESSSVPDAYYRMADTWMDRALIFGNAWPCENAFKYAVKGNPKTRDTGGDLKWA